MAYLYATSPNGTTQNIDLGHLDVGMNFTTGSGQVVFHNKFILQVCSTTPTQWVGVAVANFPISFPHGVLCLITSEFGARNYYDNKTGSLSGCNIAEITTSNASIYTLLTDNTYGVRSGDTSTWVLSMGY